MVLYSDEQIHFLVGQIMAKAHKQSVKRLSFSPLFLQLREQAHSSELRKMFEQIHAQTGSYSFEEGGTYWLFGRKLRKPRKIHFKCTIRTEQADNFLTSTDEPFELGFDVALITGVLKYYDLDNQSPKISEVRITVQLRVDTQGKLKYSLSGSDFGAPEKTFETFAELLSFMKAELEKSPKSMGFNHSISHRIVVDKA